MDSKEHGRRAGVALADEELLASLGYKQEFRREFTGLEVSTRFDAMCPRALGCANDYGCKGDKREGAGPYG